ncbi:hypothetical protein XHV734_0706 [Xanthomonas hortorum pv. vitians]|nr:hypothetical protein XHV734_0706 [Xanthomonas hortorum pv. vitians]
MGRGSTAARRNAALGVARDALNVSATRWSARHIRLAGASRPPLQRSVADETVATAKCAWYQCIP